MEFTWPDLPLLSDADLVRAKATVALLTKMGTITGWLDDIPDFAMHTHMPCEWKINQAVIRYVPHWSQIHVEVLTMNWLRHSV